MSHVRAGRTTRVGERRFGAPARAVIAVLVATVPLVATRSLVAANDPGAPIRVVSYNVLGGRNTDGARDLERLARVILTLEPDLVALQEVDRGTRRLGGLDLAAELGRRTGMKAWFGAAMEYDGGEYGEAVLSRLPVAGARVHPLPRTGDREPRAALAVRVQRPGGCEFVFVGTHLDHEPPHGDRIAQAHELLRVVRSEYGDVPVVIAGDMNAEPGSPPMRVLAQGSIGAWEARRVAGLPVAQPGPTFPSGAPDRRIDHVLLRPSTRWTVLDATTADRWQDTAPGWHDLLRVASDHLPVIVDLRIVGCSSR